MAKKKEKIVKTEQVTDFDKNPFAYEEIVDDQQTMGSEDPQLNPIDDKPPVEDKEIKDSDDKEEEGKEKEKDSSDDDKVDEELKDEIDDKKEKSGTHEKTVPYKRFDEVNKRRRVAEDKLKEMEDQAQTREEEDAQIPFDFESKESEYMDAVLEGDKDKGSILRKEIRAAEKEMYEASATKVATEQSSKTKDDIEFNQVALDLQKQYNVLDEESEYFDQEVVDEILAFTNGYLTGGQYTRIGALRKAVTQAGKIYDLQGGTTEETKEPVKKVRSKKLDPDKKKDIETKQPPKDDSVDEDLNPGPMEDLTEEDFASLPESAKRRLRGDYL